MAVQIDPADTDLVVRPAHLELALNISNTTLVVYIRKGDIPPPDGRSYGNVKLWRLETIRAWNPGVAAAIEHLLSIPAFAPRVKRYKPSGLFQAA